MKTIHTQFNGRKGRRFPVRINDPVLERELQRLVRAGFKQSQVVKAGLVLAAGTEEAVLRQIVKRLWDGRKW